MDGKQFLCLFVDDDVFLVAGQGAERYVFTLMDLHGAFGALLIFIAVAVASWQHDWVGEVRTIAIEIGRFVRTHVFITAWGRLTLAGTSKSLHYSIRHPIDGSCCPGGSVLAVSQSCTTFAGGQAEVTA